MSKIRAAASIVGGLLLALVGVVGLVALIVATLLTAYSGGLVAWLGLPLLFVVGTGLVFYGVAALLKEFSDLASDSLDGLSDVRSTEDVKELRRLYQRIS